MKEKTGDKSTAASAWSRVGLSKSSSIAIISDTSRESKYPEAVQSRAPTPASWRAER